MPDYAAWEIPKSTVTRHARDSGRADVLAHVQRQGKKQCPSSKALRQGESSPTPGKVSLFVQ